MSLLFCLFCAISTPSASAGHASERAVDGRGAPSASRVRRLASFACVLVTGLVWLLAPPASAATTYAHAGSFGSADSSNSAPPSATGVAATDQTKTAATVFSHVNSNGLDTTVHFDYGTTAAYGQNSQSQDIGSGTDSQPVSAVLTGLQADTTYHYKLVAVNGVGTTTTADATFQTQGSCPNDQYRAGLAAYLPDCRAYEQVTPVDKNGAIDMMEKVGLVTNAAFTADGNRLLLDTPGAWTADNPDPIRQSYLFDRTSSGWRLTGQVRPADAPGSASYAELWQFSPDLTRFALHELTDISNLSSGTRVNFAVGRAGGPFATADSTTYGSYYGTTAWAGASSDLSHDLLSSEDSTLTPDAAGTVSGAHDLYDYTGGSLHLVNVTSGGSLVSPCGALLAGGGSSPGGGIGSPNPVSGDGSTMFFEAPDWTASSSDPSCSAPRHLYVRVGSGTSSAATIDLGAEASGGFLSSPYQDATPDGSRVLFNASAGLTLYNVDSRTATLVAPVVADQSLISDDGSTVYFLSGAQLANAPAPDPGYGEYLYRYDVASHTLSFVLQSDTVADTALQTTGGPLVQVTPDGRSVLLTSDGVKGEFPGAQSGTLPEPALYRYDSATSSLACASCHPDGAAPGQTVELSVGNEGFAFFQTPSNEYDVMSADGRYVFFGTADRLVPRDTDTGGSSAEPAMQVFEWEAQGTGGCTSPDGCVHMLTAGTGPAGTQATYTTNFLIGASADGSNVFVLSHDRLAPSDTDTLGDVYDIRVDGGFPGPAPSVQCLGDCQGGSYSSPAPPIAASVTFAGPGNARFGSATAKAAVLTRTVRGATFLVKVTVAGGGRIAISGAGISTVRKSVSSAGTYRLRVRLTAKARSLLKHGHSRRLRLRVAYSPPGAAAAIAIAHVTVVSASLNASRHDSRTASSKSGGAR